MSTDIHRLSPDNASLLENVAPEVFDNEVNPAYLAAFLEDPRHVMFVATDGQTVVGMASGFEYFHPDKPPQLFINEVGVAASHRCQGIGRRLVAALVEFARDRGHPFAWLGTASDNIAGQRCFGSHPDVEEPQPFLLYEWNIREGSDVD